MGPSRICLSGNGVLEAPCAGILCSHPGKERLFALYVRAVITQQLPMNIKVVGQAHHALALFHQSTMFFGSASRAHNDDTSNSIPALSRTAQDNSNMAGDDHSTTRPSKAPRVFSADGLHVQHSTTRSPELLSYARPSTSPTSNRSPSQTVTASTSSALAGRRA